MRKIAILLLAFLLCLGFAACDDANYGTTTRAAGNNNSGGTTSRNPNTKTLDEVYYRASNNAITGAVVIDPDNWYCFEPDGTLSFRTSGGLYRESTYTIEGDKIISYFLGETNAFYLSENDSVIRFGNAYYVTFDYYLRHSD